MHDVSVTVAIDTEEDNWGYFAESGATTDNISHLEELQDLFGRWGARPTYLVNRPPLIASRAVEVLGHVARHGGVEIGAHCHPWNTPPPTGEGVEHSMMFKLSMESNRSKIAEVTRLIRAELGVRPTSFRAGRWGFGPTVAEALAAEGYRVDCSVSPFVDWRRNGGPDYSRAPNRPYRFDPTHPFEPSPEGVMVEIPTTVGFLEGDHRRRGAVRSALAASPLRHLGVIGALDRAGWVRRRWLSPETASGEEMLQLAEACLESGEPVLGMTFHSCALLPGATPFVRDEGDRKRFLDAIEVVLRFCAQVGTFKTLREVGEGIAANR